MNLYPGEMVEAPAGLGYDLLLTYQPVDGLIPGETLLRIRKTSTLAESEVLIPMTPWNGDSWVAFPCPATDALIVCGADRLALVCLSSGRVRTSLFLEVGEAETLDAPWFVRSLTDLGELVLIATERNVWCFDEPDLRLRWSWTARHLARDCWIRCSPEVGLSDVEIPLRDMAADFFVAIALDDGRVREHT